MKKSLFKFFSFLIAIALIIVVLKILYWLPSAIQPDIMKSYKSVEEAKSKLNIREIYIPSYFPEGLLWPPSNVLAQKKPYTVIVMEFKDKKGNVALIISQAASNKFTPDRKIKMTQIRQKVNFNLKGRNANLVVGLCKNEDLCSTISWNERHYSLTVIARLSPADLIKLCESMIH